MLDYRYTIGLGSKLLQRQVEYIKFYEVKNQKIILHTSNGVVYKDYSKSLELSILRKMKEQIDWYMPYIRVKKKIKYKNPFYLPGLLCETASLVYGLKSFTPSRDILSIICLLILPVLHVKKGLHPSNTFTINRLYEDAVKNKLFNDNEELINKNLLKAIIRNRVTKGNRCFIPPLYDVHATLNDAHFLSRDEIENLIDGNIDGEMILTLYKGPID